MVGGIWRTLKNSGKGQKLISTLMMMKYHLPDCCWPEAESLFKLVLPCRLCSGL